MSQASERVVIFDTTLRDGEQSPGISLDVGEKLEIADQLARLGVDYIEAGFPIASQGDFEAVLAIAKSVRGPVICGLSRTALKDIDRCWEAIEPAEKHRIHTFIATSETHMKHKLRMTPEQVLNEAARAVAHARNYTADVEFSPEDASRSDFDFMCTVLQAAVAAGATTLNIPDTVGYAIPEEWAELLRRIRGRVTGDYVISTHCHNDLGLAVANSLAAVNAGARQVECTINGIGERAGNAALEEIVMALKTRADTFGGIDTGIKTDELARSSRIVSRLTGYPGAVQQGGRRSQRVLARGRHPPARRAARAHHLRDHGSGRRRHGRVQVGAGQAFGRAAFKDALQKMGVEIHGDGLEAAFTRFKELADRKIQLSEADLEALVAEELGGHLTQAFELVSLDLVRRHDAHAHGHDHDDRTRRRSHGHRVGRRLGRCVVQGDPFVHRHGGHLDRLQRPLGYRWCRRTGRRVVVVRVERWHQGVGSRFVDRCRRSFGSSVHRRAQPGAARARLWRRPVQGHPPRLTPRRIPAVPIHRSRSQPAHMLHVRLRERDGFQSAIRVVTLRSTNELAWSWSVDTVHSWSAATNERTMGADCEWLIRPTSVMPFCGSIDKTTAELVPLLP